MIPFIWFWNLIDFETDLFKFALEKEADSRRDWPIGNGRQQKSRLTS